ncbi:glycosyltransferase family 2 protein [Caballeronia sp. M1242]|uniref:glycosyltransferase family 2 protein n=1 Tax=Caballeronia sp. M1242 TaxID=2814653 RepID=UPI001F49EB30|nr:glycosyltransferase family 2 protein [Caballeronia sp. M1242]
MHAALTPAEVSIVIPCFNAAATLVRALNSCLAQPEAAQIIVVDDGSEDTSLDIARSIALTDARVQLLQTPANGGAARARNLGAQYAAHPLLAFLDADDEYCPAPLLERSARFGWRRNNTSCGSTWHSWDIRPTSSGSPGSRTMPRS